MLPLLPLHDRVSYTRITSVLHTATGRYELEESDDGSYFLDCGSVSGHVLAYLRDGVVAAGHERDVRAHAWVTEARI